MKRLLIVSSMIGVVAALAGGFVLAGGIGKATDNQTQQVQTSSVAAAELQTVTLDVKGLSCPSCSHIVRGALESVDGVKSARVSGGGKAVVRFDPARVSTEQLTAATGELGFPSSVVN